MKSFLSTPWLAALVVLLSVSCTEDEPGQLQPESPLAAFENGFLVLHEGQFLAGNASISAVSSDFQTQANDLFAAVNKRPLGDVAQSMAFRGEVAFIVVNNSQTVEVVETRTLQSVATMDGTTDGDLRNPRYMAFLGNKGYVTNWGDGLDPDDDFLAVVDLDTYEVVEKIPMAEGPEQIISDGSRLYIAHQGGFGQNNKVSVVESDHRVQTLEVGDVPNGLAWDGGDNVWVLCGGKPAWTGEESAGGLYRIRRSDLEVELERGFGLSEHPSLLQLEGSRAFYVLDGALHGQDLGEELPPADVLFGGVNYYGLLVDQGLIYGLDAVDFTSSGTFEVRTADGSLITALDVGVVPSKIYRFNP